MTLVPPTPKRQRRSPASAAALWLGLYLLAVTVPLFALLPAPASAGAGFAWDFAMALGYAGIAMLGVQFALTARFKRATSPFGIDIVYYFHRYLAIAAVLLVTAHVALLQLMAPMTLDPRVAPAHLTAGRIGFVLFVLLVLSSVLRHRLRLPYEAWRIAHALLATTGFALALWHLVGAGRYLDETWKRALWLAYGLFWLALIAHVRVLRPARLAARPWRVRAVRAERGRVTTLVLDPPAGQRIDFAPGQFAWLSLARTPWTMQEHPFSIASSAAQHDEIELSIKALGDFSSAVQQVRPGTIAWVDAPYGTFGIDALPEAPGYVFVAGGVGIAPIMSMLRSLADRGDRRPLVLFYGNSAWDRIAFREELDTLTGRLPLRVVHVLQEPLADWPGEVGLVTQAVLDRHLPPAPLRQRLHYLLCGPTPMTLSVERSLAALRVPAAQVHSELFDWV
ncbi:MAG: ferric reductase-like transmembrane domain-containing protein [Betaproteobacteria bacterium]|jgi:predicted ferric reductase